MGGPVTIWGNPGSSLQVAGGIFSVSGTSPLTIASVGMLNATG